MIVTDIPFVKHLGITSNTEGDLQMPFSIELQNHLKTVHASAQFALAETASGNYLQIVFPELVGKVIPLLRDAQVKFKKPTHTSITAIPEIDEEAIKRFRSQLEKKGRASIQVNVRLLDEEGAVTCLGSYNWFVAMNEINSR